MNTSSHQQESRRTDIQLLRGSAVLGVMLAHFGGLVPGGFLGVDVFFVISGFVISLSLWSLLEKQPPNVRLLTLFWRRRFFRLVPMLGVVLTATLVFASLTLPPRDFGDQVEMTVWSMFFAGNIGVEVISRADYFDPAAEENWLLHLWSLGVEEQFYLIFPLLFLLVFASRWGSPRTGVALLTIGTLASVSFGLALLNDADAVLGWGGVFTESTGLSALLGYYSPLTRAWQFLVGVIAAIWTLRRGALGGWWLPVLGASGVVACYALVPESDLLPGVPTLFVVVAVFLILVSNASPSVTDSVWLAPLRWIGNRSYSAYLWHWPVWLFLQSHVGAGLTSIALAFLITFLLSAISYVAIELPFIAQGKKAPSVSRASHSRAPKNTALTTLLALPIFFGFGITASLSILQDKGLLITAPPVPQLAEDRDCLRTDCSENVIDALLIGDSHAGSLGNALHARLATEGISLYGSVIARNSGCLHLPSTTVSSIHRECQELSQLVRDIVAFHRPPVVILHGYTAGRFTEINSGGEAEIALVNNVTGDAVTASTGVSAYKESLRETVDILEAVGASVVIVSGVPDFTLRPEEVGRSGEPAAVAELLAAPWLDLEFGQSVTRDEYLARHGDFLAVERAIAEGPSVSLLEPWEALCSDTICSQSTDDGQFLYADTDHVSDVGAQRLAEHITRHLETTGLLEQARSAR